MSGLGVVVAVVALWVHNGGVASLAGTGGIAIGIGRLTGLVASAMLLIQVILMARIPWVERVWGQDRLARRHRWVGFSSFTLMLAHIALIAIGYAQVAHANVLGETWNLVINYPGMLIATAGTLALVMVAGTSLRAARRRLRYESWHLLHLYAYLGVGLALPHQLWTGAEFTASPLTTIFWWGLWAASAGAIIVFRITFPLYRTLRHRLVVEAVIPEGPGVFSVIMAGHHLDRLELKAGQFCQWRFLGGAGATRAHPFSISAPPTQHRIRITAKALGEGSARLACLRPGTRVAFEGPYGAMTAEVRRRRDALMICAGIGITPMRALAEHITAERPSADVDCVRAPAVTILHRVRSPQDLTFNAEFRKLAKTRNITVIPLVGRRGPENSIFPGPEPHDAARALRELVPDVQNREIYLCGPKDFMAQSRSLLASAGVDPLFVHAEEFSW
ncbi:oxidoreductase [Nakamurella antarctica]|uniref:Oxidoreductase n=1 Tax=Nakamurella antarctica TaxID=1902245 RepID=A0A3G8ZYW8_9ACTN|nr:oxidoreductase [Nakamurella antarctica]